MKEIILGIKDYCKDCWHDWLMHRLIKTYPDENIREEWLWKEGNLWHYIRQRKIAKERKEHAKLHNKTRQ